MGGISVGDEGLRSCQIAMVGEFVIRSALDISKEVFESIPVCRPGLALKRARYATEWAMSGRVIMARYWSDPTALR